MKDLCFESKLTDREIEDNFKNVDFFEGITHSLEEAVEYSKGNKPDGILVNNLQAAV